MDIPVTLVAPDGREHTAKTQAEANNLILGRGYRIQTPPAPEPEPRARKTRNAPVEAAEQAEPVSPDQPTA